MGFYGSRFGDLEHQFDNCSIYQVLKRKRAGLFQSFHHSNDSYSVGQECIEAKEGDPMKIFFASYAIPAPHLQKLPNDSVPVDSCPIHKTSLKKLYTHLVITPAS